MNNLFTRDNSGFTLFELIVVLMLIGIVAAGVGGAVAYGTRGYMFVKENTAISQKGQLALQRMQLELTEMTDINCAASGNTCIVYRDAQASSFYRGLGVRDNQVEIVISTAADQTCPSSGNPGVPLTDRVGALSFQYEDMSGAITLTPPGTGLSDLAAIHIQLTLVRMDNNPPTLLTTSVVPRNNRRKNTP